MNKSHLAQYKADLKEISETLDNLCLLLRGEADNSPPWMDVLMARDYVDDAVDGIDELLKDEN